MVGAVWRAVFVLKLQKTSKIAKNTEGGILSGVRRFGSV
jgi:hypothetical protein